VQVVSGNNRLKMWFQKLIANNNYNFDAVALAA